MPSRLDSCTKIFVGNFAPGTPMDEIRAMFAKYGEVVECDIVRNFCFLHMSDEKEAHQAIEALNGYVLGGRRLNVEESTSEVRQKPGMGGSDKCFFCGDGGHWSRDCPKRGPGGRNHGGRSTKIYVGNVTEATTEEELRELFGKYGTVTECAKVKNYAFIHMKSDEEADAAIEGLKGHVLNGNTLTIEASTSRPRPSFRDGGSSSSSLDRYSARSAWEGALALRSVRGADRASMMRSSVDPYALSSSAALRSAYARERPSPYPSPYLSRYVSVPPVDHECVETLSKLRQRAFLLASCSPAWGLASCYRGCKFGIVEMFVMNVREIPSHWQESNTGGTDFISVVRNDE